MSFDDSGFENPKHKPCDINIGIKSNHPLVQLANVLCWNKLLDLILPDLKETTAKGQWWLGRPLHLRVHLAAYLLQQLFNKTDRHIEYDIKDNAAYQVFCGITVVKKWHCPDHTKIEEFRSRLKPETQKELANTIAAYAVNLGFADCRDVDVDSTIQEANMAYPMDSSLLCKLGSMATKVAGYMNKTMSVFDKNPMKVDMKSIRTYARRYFFCSDKDKKKIHFKALYERVADEVSLVTSNAQCLAKNITEKMSWNMGRVFTQFRDKSEKYLEDVKHFIDNGKMVPNKILSFHLNQVKCFSKDKPGKKYHFGRMFQLGRIKGNFLFAGKGCNASMPDKKSIELMFNEHQKTFDNESVHSFTTDKGYFSKANEKFLDNNGVEDIAIQRPHNIKKPAIKSLTKEKEQLLSNRRSGIEPLIGHAKHGGQLGRSRMKSDETIEASGFTAILGFNLRQLIRYQTGKAIFNST
jgi:hypothetical protein